MCVCVCVYVCVLHVCTQMFKPTLAPEESLTQFHSKDYIAFLKSVSPDNKVCVCLCVIRVSMSASVCECVRKSARARVCVCVCAGRKR